MMNQEEARKEISKEKGPNTPTFVLVHLLMTEKLLTPLEDAPQHQLLCLKEISGGGRKKTNIYYWVNAHPYTRPTLDYTSFSLSSISVVQWPKPG